MKTLRVPEVIPRSVRVMLVDDSAIVRGIMRRWIDAEPGLDVVGSATNGEQAISEAKKCLPDVIVLDLEMPVLSGIDALPILKGCLPDAKILISSALSTRNATVSLAALNAGAADYIAKPDQNTPKENFRAGLLQKLHGLNPQEDIRLTQPPSELVTHDRRWQGSMSALLIGASTGGPQALSQLFSSLKGSLHNVSVFVTQHLPEPFTRPLGDELATAAGLTGGQAIDGEIVTSGRLYLAPGGFHMRVDCLGEERRIRLDDGPSINFCKPAVDPMFQSASDCFGPDCVAVVLTGMGSDGALGTKTIQRNGGIVIAQDQASSIVWGMPAAAIATGAVAHVRALNQIAPCLLKLQTHKASV